MASVTCNSLDTISWQGDSLPHLDREPVAVWRLWLPQELKNFSQAYLLLDAAERQRAAGYKREQDRQRFVLSRAALRILLSSCTGMAPEAIRFALSGDKKPYLPDHPAIHYNVAHSGDVVLIAIATIAAGVDVEQINPNFDYSDVSASCFSNREQRVISSSREFYTCWTRKESLLKATGKGIDDEMAMIPCLDGKHEIPGDVRGVTGEWVTDSFAVGEGYAGAVAYRGDLPQVVSFHDFRFSD